MLFSTSLMSLMVGICMHAQISAKSQSHSSRPVAQGFVPKPAYELFNLLDNKQQSTKTPAGTSKLRLVQASETKGAGGPSQLKDGGNTGSTQVVSFNRKPEVNPQSSSGTLRDDGPEQTQKSVNTPVYNTALEAKMETIQPHTLPVSPLEEYDLQEYDLTDNLKNDALDALPKDANRNDAMPAPGSGWSRSTETEIEINIPTASALQTSNPDDKTTTRTGLQTEQNLRSHEGIAMKSNGVKYSDVIADENVIYSGAPGSGRVFRADRQHELRTLQEGVAQANAGFLIPIQTRSGGCSMPAVLGGGDTLPWTCRQSQQWRYLGENVYPSRLYETVCEGSCWYGHYNCSPIYYTLHVLKTCGQRCNDQRVPYPLRSRWQWLSYNVTVGCQCVR